MQDNYKYKYYKYKLKYTNIKKKYKNISYQYVLSGGYNNNTPDEDTPEDTPDTDTPEDTPEDTPVDTPDTDTPVDTSDTATPVDTSDTDTPVETSEDSSKVDTSDIDTPLETSDADTPLETSDADTPGDTSDADTPDTNTLVDTSKVDTTLSDKVFLPPKIKQYADTVVEPAKDIEGYNYKVIDEYINTINEYITQITTIMQTHSPEVESNTNEFTAKDSDILMKLANKIYDYILKNDIPINFNVYDINNLQKTIEQLKIQLEKTHKLYKLRYKLFNINNIPYVPRKDQPTYKTSEVNPITPPYKNKDSNKSIIPSAITQKYSDEINETLSFSSKEKDKITLGEKQSFSPNETTRSKNEFLPCTGNQCNETLPFSSKEKDKITLGEKQSFSPDETTRSKNEFLPCTGNQCNETNMNYALDYVIRYYKISNIHDIEKLFTSLLMGYNKNYIFYYMILIRWLTLNNKYLYVLKDYVSVLSYNNLYNYLNADINMDEYIPFIIILINRYIANLKFDRFLEIKPYTNETSHKSRLAPDIIDGIIMTQYDSKNGALLYEYDIMKLPSQISFNDLIAIIYNLFRTKLIYRQ